MHGFCNSRHHTEIEISDLTASSDVWTSEELFGRLRIILDNRSWEMRLKMQCISADCTIKQQFFLMEWACLCTDARCALKRSALKRRTIMEEYVYKIFNLLLHCKIPHICTMLCDDLVHKG